LESFHELHLKHHQLFDVRTIRGFQVCHTIHFASSSFGYSVNFLPTEYGAVYDAQKQQQVLRPLPSTAFKAEFTSGGDDVDFTAVFHSSAKLISAHVRPFDFCGIHARLQFVSVRTIVPTLGGFLTLPHLNCQIQGQSVDWLHVNSIDGSVAVGSREMALAFQFLHRPAAPIAYVCMLHRLVGDSRFACSMTRDTDLMLSCSMQRRIRNWRVGVGLYVNNKLASELELGWVTKIGRSTIHSAIKSWGDVRSLFGASVLPGVDLVFTGHLDHSEHRYRFGMSLEWDAPAKKE
jgi:hypothetical protein